jgi:hypothetical protein
MNNLDVSAFPDGKNNDLRVKKDSMGKSYPRVDK